MSTKHKLHQCNKYQPALLIAVYTECDLWVHFEQLYHDGEAWAGSPEADPETRI